MKRISLAGMLVFLCFSVSAQIKITENNYVGIGESNPVSRLSIFGPGDSYSTVSIDNEVSSCYSRGLAVYNSITTSYKGYALYANTSFTSNSASSNYGTYSISYSSTPISSRRAYGIWGRAGNATPGWNYGVYGELIGSNKGAAIYGTIPGRGDTYIDSVYAGYFNGTVYIEDYLNVSGTYYSSDIGLKKDIRYVADEAVRQTDRLKALHAIKYKLKTPVELGLIRKEITDTLSIATIAEQYNYSKYTRDYIGISAQEIQQEFPEIVKEDPSGYLSVDYTRLIPILIEAIKEQDAEIEALKNEVATLRLANEKL
jgi:hypothetical protein